MRPDRPASTSSIAGYDDPVAGVEDATGSDGAAQIRSVSGPELKSLLTIVVAALAIAALYFGREVLIPITLAVMLSFLLSPVVNGLQRLRVPRAPAVMLTVIVALGVVGLLAALIGSQAASLTADAPKYAQTIEAKVQNVQTIATARVAAITNAIGHGHAPSRAGTAPAATLTRPVPARGAPQRRPVLVQVAQEQPSPFAIARTILSPVLGPLETLLIVLVVAIFVLLQKEDLRDRFIRLVGSNDLHRTTLAMDDAGQRLSRYFLSQLAVNTSFGIVIGLGLWGIGIPSSAMWGLLAGLLRFVPYVGSALAAVAPIALGAAIDPAWAMAVEVLLLFVIVEPLTGYVVEPLLYGHSTGLSPVSVIVSAIFWTWLWGPIGLIISTPLTLCLVVLGRHVKSLEFFDVLLGDRPALTPIESFYQRILADNPDEALAQAELLLADRPLIDYYDAVVLQGIKLAAEDEARGTIDRRRAAEMTRSMLNVIEELKDHRDGGARPIGSALASGGEVACISGRGPFDDSVSAMLVQILAQQGIAARAVGNADVGKERVGDADLDGVTVIALSYLELNGSPAHLRYLIRRLRQRAPGARVVVGLWPGGEAALSDTDIQRAIGADRYVESLHGAADAVRELLHQQAEPGTNTTLAVA